MDDTSTMLLVGCLVVVVVMVLSSQTKKDQPTKPAMQKEEKFYTMRCPTQTG
jgi:hypothetical protein